MLGGFSACESHGLEGSLEEGQPRDTRDEVVTQHAQRLGGLEGPGV